MRCDHDASRASFAAFIGSTRLIGGQDDGEGGWLLLGTCVACNTTLAIPIAERRGHVVHGVIATDDPPPIRETAEEHAARVIK